MNDHPNAVEATSQDLPSFLALPTPACLLCGEYCSPEAMFHGLCPDCTAPHISHAEAA
jgi:hypothetical protein